MNRLSLLTGVLACLMILLAAAMLLCLAACKPNIPETPVSNPEPDQPQAEAVPDTFPEGTVICGVTSGVGSSTGPSPICAGWFIMAGSLLSKNAFHCHCMMQSPSLFG